MAKFSKRKPIRRFRGTEVIRRRSRIKLRRSGSPIIIMKNESEYHVRFSLNQKCLIVKCTTHTQSAQTTSYFLALIDKKRDCLYVDRLKYSRLYPRRDSFANYHFPNGYIENLFIEDIDKYSFNKQMLGLSFVARTEFLAMDDPTLISFDGPSDVDVIVNKIHYLLRTDKTSMCGPTAPPPKPPPDYDYD